VAVYLTAVEDAFGEDVDFATLSSGAPLPALQLLARHKTLRVTPTMEAGVSNPVWCLGEIVNLLHEPLG
jgi:hypothetical protein